MQMLLAWRPHLDDRFTQGRVLVEKICSRKELIAFSRGLFVPGLQVTSECLASVDTVNHSSRPVRLHLALQWNGYLLTLASQRACFNGFRL